MWRDWHQEVGKGETKRVCLCARMDLNMDMFKNNCQDQGRKPLMGHGDREKKNEMGGYISMILCLHTNVFSSLKKLTKRLHLGAPQKLAA